MPRLYIKGLVKTADFIRHELSQLPSAGRREEVRRIAEQSVEQVDAILARHGAQLQDLPVPTRRAYQFLRNLDVNSAVSAQAVEPDARAAGTVALTGLKSFWDSILEQLAQPISAEPARLVSDSIGSSSASIEGFIRAKRLRTEDLTTQSRNARGWLAFFADRDNFDAYLRAIARARSALEGRMSHLSGFTAPALIQFRPLPGLYRIRGHRDRTRIALPTPMISFSDQLFEALAAAAFDGGSKQQVVEATFDEEYQGIQAELDALCGVEEGGAGVHHHLQAAFDRVNERYFGGEMRRPRLTWSRTFTGRKFGHYDPIRDVVMLSRTMDRSDVPAFVVDSVMYHELLHKQLGIDWRNGRRAVHTSEFKEAEKRFEQATDAEATLAAMARGVTQLRPG